MKINEQRGIGVTLPLRRGPTGYFTQSYDIKTQVKSNLVNLVMTRKGERIFQPEFGCGIYEYLFEPLTDTTMASMRGVIEEAIQFWLPYVIIQTLDVSKDSNSEHTIIVKLSYSLRNIPNIFDTITFVFTP